MGFFNPIAMAKDALKKADLNHNKVPDVYEALDAAEAGTEMLADWLDDIDQDEAFAALSALNMFRKPEKRKTSEELKALATKFVAIPVALRSVKTALEAAEAEIRKP